MKYILLSFFISICITANAQEFLKADLTEEDGRNYKISLSVTATFFNPMIGRNDVLNIKVNGTSEGNENFISEDVTSFFVSTVIQKELEFMAGIMKSRLKGFQYSKANEPGDPNVEFKLNLKPDRIEVKASIINGNIPEIPLKSYMYSSYMK